MEVTFEDLLQKMNGIKRDQAERAEVSIEIIDKRFDIFSATWKYPVKNTIIDTENYIGFTYRFKMDIELIELLWKTKFGTTMPAFPYILRILEYKFFDIIPFTKDFNEKSDDYVSILMLLYESRGVGLKEYEII